MNDHSYYEELSALLAGGHLSGEELGILLEHLANCPGCRREAGELRLLVRSGLSLVGDDRFKLVDRIKVQPDPGARDRFLARARTEGLRFSLQEVHNPVLAPLLRLGLRAVMVTAGAAVLLLTGFYGPSVIRRASTGIEAVQETNHLKQQNKFLSARLAQREQEVAAQQNQIGDLRGQLGKALKTAENYRREGEQKGVRLEQSTSQAAQLLDELQNRDKQLALSSAEIDRINQLHVFDQVSLESQQARIKDISDQLRIAEATLDAERQLTATEGDIRQLLIARQLHVIDVRDTDANGRAGRAFARVFLTEGKSLMFFAFDLNASKAANAKTSFQVWGEQIGKKDSVRSLGVLSMNDQAQNRWELKVRRADLLSQINSVFVTVSSAGRGGSGQRLLYAYLGQPAHS